MKRLTDQLSYGELTENRPPSRPNTDVWFRFLIDQFLDGVIILGKDGLIHFLNPSAEKLLGKTTQELVGTKLGLTLSPYHVSEIEISLSNNSRRTVEIRLVEIEWKNEQVYLATLRDFTELRRAEQERKQHEVKTHYTKNLESLENLAGGIAHDFNNILLTVIARAGLARRALDLESSAHDHLNQIEKAGLRGGELANQMLIYAGRGKSEIQKVNVSKLIKDMGHLLTASISKPAVFHFEMAKKPLLIQADPTQIQKILLTLISNASEAIGGRHGVITLGTGLIQPNQNYSQHWYIIGELPGDTAVYIEVRDTGCGMSQDMLPKIFDPFYTTKFIGRGLGLAALVGIVRAQGGAVAVASQLGEGTQVRAYFPALVPQETDSRPTTFPTKTWHGSGTILVIDDEEDVCVTSRLILEKIGFRVLTAPDGPRGLAEFRKSLKEIKLVLLDLSMPTMNGQEVFKEIRQLRKDLRVILSSGYSEKEALKLFSSSRPNAFIQKPYQIEGLIEKVRQVLGP